jgi:predicted transcriptional regulator
MQRLLHLRQWSLTTLPVIGPLLLIGENQPESTHFQNHRITAMTETESKHLRHLLTAFDARALGEGDEVAGANVLATMAGVLADLAPTDGTILTKEGRPARLGLNLLVTGPAITGMVVDEVLTELNRRQSNLWHYLLRYAKLIEAQKQKAGASLPPMDPKRGAPEDRIGATQQEIEPLFYTRAASWSRVFSEAPGEDVIALISRPKFLISLSRPGDFSGQLQGVRPGYPLVHAGCSKPSDLSALADAGAALIEGRYPLGTGCEAVRGHLLITDPHQALHRAAKDPDEGTAWLGHFLWICDSKAGPEAPDGGAQPDQPETITERFRIALDAVLATRMNLPEKQPVQLPLPTREAKVRFRDFLAEMEPRLPGISMAARNLIDSLVFGLGELARIEKRLPLSIGGVESLARFLVARMANARTMMMHSGAVIRRRSQIERVYRKLQKEPAGIRKICGDLNLLVHDCEPCLRWLEEAGIARPIDRKYELVEDARLRFEDHKVPLIEV